MPCDDVKKILLTETQIQERVKQIGQQITKDFKGKEVLMVGVLKGCYLFFADLIRQIDLGVMVDFIDISTYGMGMRSSGEVRFLKDIGTSVNGKHIILVEDIIDTGITMKYVQQLLYTRGAQSVSIASLLSKPSRRSVSIIIDYLGFEIPDEFVVGYGLDYAEKYRGLPYIGVLKDDLYK
ncbi:MAG: hypoxanthine phosphoribosyltransferase [Clostridia bacterium]|nr:hypoxanthine phosphoribosyltransferase [Clostridia bacterium]